MVTNDNRIRDAVNHYEANCSAVSNDYFLRSVATMERQAAHGVMSSADLQKRLEWLHGPSTTSGEAASGTAGSKAAAASGGKAPRIDFSCFVDAGGDGGAPCEVADVDLDELSLESVDLDDLMNTKWDDSLLKD